MRSIDLYRGIKPPCHRFDPFFNPEYQRAFQEAAAAIKELEKYDIPHELIDRIDKTHNALTATEVDLMRCFAFAEGIEFQKSLCTDIKHYDVTAE